MDQFPRLRALHGLDVGRQLKIDFRFHFAEGYLDLCELQSFDVPPQCRDNNWRNRNGRQCNSLGNRKLSGKLAYAVEPEEHKTKQSYNPVTHGTNHTSLLE